MICLSVELNRSRLMMANIDMNLTGKILGTNVRGCYTGLVWIAKPTIIVGGTCPWEEEEVTELSMSIYVSRLPDYGCPSPACRFSLPQRGEKTKQGRNKLTFISWIAFVKVFFHKKKSNWCTLQSLQYMLYACSSACLFVSVCIHWNSGCSFAFQLRSSVFASSALASF